MKKAYVLVTARIVMKMEDDLEVGPVTEEMDYSFTSKTDGVEFEDVTLRDIEVSKIERNVDQDGEH